MILPLVLWANIAQQEPSTYIHGFSDKFVLVRNPGDPPAKLTQAIKANRHFRISALFPVEDYDRLYVEGTEFLVIIEKTAVPVGPLHDSLKVLTAIAKSPTLTAAGKEIPDSIAEMAFARSFVDFSKATPEARNQLTLGAKLTYQVKLTSGQKQRSFGYLPPMSKTSLDQVLQMTWPTLPQSVIKGEEPGEHERPQRPRALNKEVTTDYTHVGRPVDGKLMSLVNDAIQRRITDLEKEISEKSGEIEARIVEAGVHGTVLKPSGAWSDLPQKVREDMSVFASLPGWGNPVHENEPDILSAPWEHFTTTKRFHIVMPVRRFPGNESVDMMIAPLQ